MEEHKVHYWTKSRKNKWMNTYQLTGEHVSCPVFNVIEISKIRLFKRDSKTTIENANKRNWMY